MVMDVAGIPHGQHTEELGLKRDRKRSYGARREASDLEKKKRVAQSQAKLVREQEAREREGGPSYASGAFNEDPLHIVSQHKSKRKRPNPDHKVYDPQAAHNGYNPFGLLEIKVVKEGETDFANKRTVRQTGPTKDMAEEQPKRKQKRTAAKPNQQKKRPAKSSATAKPKDPATVITAFSPGKYDTDVSAESLPSTPERPTPQHDGSLVIESLPSTPQHAATDPIFMSTPCDQSEISARCVIDHLFACWKFHGE
ncbi:hypothetical protein QZH41_005023 [Actinostola sp. cb2023]|nr:hypothetical protein QZH41_005023 [Actinostola sp. cb2023]